ncbi:MAG: thioredoxin family protein [candidate division Zixibacteria bacterium]|nr:thioredoxin family protein [candidate division Zixibacteria bacterium]
MAIYRKGIFKLAAILSLALILNQAFAENSDEGLKSADIAAQDAEEYLALSGLEALSQALTNDKPTLAYFFQSVACSCVAAQCALTDTTIDSVAELKDNESFDFVRVDIFYTDAAESLYKVDIVPAFVYYNDMGTEINRLEWTVTGDLLRQLIAHPEKKLNP